MRNSLNVSVTEHARLPGIIRDTAQGAMLSVHVQPRASHTECVGLHGTRLKFRVAAPPVNGTANEVLCRHLAERLRLSKGAVVVVSGQEARQKQILMKGVSAQRVRKALLTGV